MMRKRRGKWLSLALTIAAFGVLLYCLSPKAADRSHDPSVLPDRIILSWTGDPATTQAVSWRTNSSVGRAFAQVAVAADGPDFAEHARQVPAVTTPIVSDLGKYHNHAAQFDDLQPGTLYVYRMGAGKNWSAWNHFRTASKQPEPFTFLYFGDAQNEIRSHWSRVVRQAYSVAPDARFMLHVGDLIDRQSRDSLWGEWHSASGWINAVVPSMAVPGNHEYAHGVGRTIDRLSMYWRPQFQFPENGPNGLEETAYYFDYQGVRFIGLNSNERIQDQAVWLERVLRENPHRWVIVAHHHPLYTASDLGRNNVHLRKAWQPIYDKYRVDLVLQGHDHSYGRTGLRAYKNLSSGTNTVSDAGTVYVVSISGPKLHPPNDDDFVSRAAGIQLFQVITIDGNHLKYEARTATGRIHDAFTLRKRPGQVNKLLEETPGMIRTEQMAHGKNR